ncbi:MAG: relaxase/mobilization nuclease domain-containing protein [Pseudomonadota bacterium]
MILKGAQRGAAKQLAIHLLNEFENDHVEVHEVSGFLSEDITGAFKEVQAVAKGTRCKQPFFSVSLSPPLGASVTIEQFEDAVERIAVANGLTGQPRAIVFHEKDGRRHAHAVWSRIDADTMTAKNLPHFKNRLMAISRDLYFEHQWKMPPGLRDRSVKSPANVTLAEWQAAKRRGKNAVDQKKLIQQCWATSDSQVGFQAALGEHGYILAKGDRRGHVIVCHDGEVFAVTRATGLKTKYVRGRLGELKALPSVADAIAQHARDVRRQFIRMAGDARSELATQRAKLDAERTQMIGRHRNERDLLQQGQAKRWKRESATRAGRFKNGLRGLWQRLIGETRQIEEQNAKEAFEALQRDRRQRQQMIDLQLRERHSMENERAENRQQAFGLLEGMRADRDRLLEKLLQSPRLQSKCGKQQEHKGFNLET